MEIALALIDHTIPTRTVAIHTNCPLHSIITIEVSGLDAFNKVTEEWDITGVVSDAVHGLSVHKKSYLPEIGQKVIVHYNTTSHKGKIYFFDKDVSWPLFCSHTRPCSTDIIPDQYVFNRGQRIVP